MKTTQTKLADIHAAAVNPRRHPDKQIAAIVESIKRFGFTLPVLIDERSKLIAGHARVEAARQLGMATVPTVTAKGWSATKRREYLLADNQLATMSTWNKPELAASLQDLLDQGVDMAALGFAADTASGPSRTAEGEERTARCKAGDLFVCGEHRLIVGDATDKATVARLTGKRKPRLMITDPPYGVDYDPKWRIEARKGGANGDAIAGDSHADWREAYALFTGEAIYVWHGATSLLAFFTSVEAAGFTVEAHIAWVKHHTAIGRGAYHWKHEGCIYAIRTGGKAIWNGKADSTLWRIDREAKHAWGHPTGKPLECMLRPITNSTNPGDFVYDPFIGSGTTMIAAERSGRRCLGIEIDPQHAAATLARWESETGNKARRER